MLELTNNLNIETIELIAARIETRLVQEYSFIPEGFLRGNITKISEELFDLGKPPPCLAMLLVYLQIYFLPFLLYHLHFFFLKDGSKIRRDVLKLFQTNTSKLP